MVLLVISNPPLNNYKAQERLDLLLSMASVEIEINLLFISYGVFQLYQGNYLAIQRKPFSAAYQSLHYYDIDKIYILDETINSDLSIDCQIINTQQAKKLVADNTKIIRI